MKNTILFFVIACLFTSCKNNNTTNADTVSSTSESSDKSVAEKIADAVTGERYGIKAAIVESEMNMEKMGKVTTTKYFDDYGKKELTKSATAISMMGKEINSVSYSMMKDDYIYIWQEGAKDGSKMKMDASKFDPKDANFDKLTQEMKDKLKIKEEGSEDILGKTCKVISFTLDDERAKGATGKSSVWKGIALKSEFGMLGHTMLMEAKKLDENPSFSANQFELPADVTFKELNIPAKK